MPNLYNIQDRLAARRKRKRAQHKAAQPARAARHTRLLKGGCVAVVLVVFLALALLVGDANYHATAIGWVPFLLAIVAVVGAGVYVRLLARTLTFSDATELVECKRDEDVPFCVTFENTGPLFFFSVKAHLYTSDMFGNVATERVATLALAPHETQQLHFAARFEHIGTYTAGLDRVEISDYLGLFTRTLHNTARREVRVVPLLTRLHAVGFSHEAVVETTRASRSVLADSMDYAYVRDYELGDPLRAIHWKLSARADKYMTRLYEVQTNPGVAIILDFYAPFTETNDVMSAFDTVVESAFSLATHARERGLDVEVVFRGRDGQVVRSSAFSAEERSRLIADMPAMQTDAAASAVAAALVEDEYTSKGGQGNIMVCSASLAAPLLDALVQAKLARRAPMMVSVVPAGIIERDRDAYLKPLARLTDADVAYVAISDARELAGANL